MAGKGQGRGHGGGQGHGREQRHDDNPGGGMRPEEQDGPIGRSGDSDPVGTDDLDRGPGRSDDSPGHRKKAAGAQSARDFAPGRQRGA